MKNVSQASSTKPVPPSSHRTRPMRGQSLVEFALVAPMFFLLVFAVADVGRLFYVQMTLQNAVRQAGRYAMTGNHLSGQTRVQSVIQIAQQAAMGLNVTNIQINGQGNCTVTGNTCSAGGPGTPVTISLTTNLQLITPLVSKFFGNGGIYEFTVSVTFQNQIFPPSSTT